MGRTKSEVFQRVEKKYILTAEEYRLLAERISPYMKVDQYGLSTICNIYYDTEDYELIRYSIEKPIFKEKLRLRCYGVPDKMQSAFVEIKKKYNGIVYKRRIELPLWEAEDYLERRIAPKTPVNPQILKEIDYFLSFYHPGKKMYIAYDRLAMYGLEDAALRMTFDFRIRGREQELEMNRGDQGALYFKKGEVVMEIKTIGAYPLWLSNVLSELEIYPGSFSKYGAFYKMKL